MNIRLAKVRGFCAGVDRAIEIVKKVLEINGSPVYVKHEVVHNKTVVDELSSMGAIFVEDLRDIPNDEVVIYSAHGVSRKVQDDSKKKKLDVFDATCPLVSKVHSEVKSFTKLGYDCVLIGHRNHPEVEGTMGQFDSSQGRSIYLVEEKKDLDKLKNLDENRLAYVTQTTLSIDDTREITESLIKMFPKIKGPRKDDICYATQNRQDAVKQLALESDIVLVVGSIASSNSNRLREIAERSGVDSYLIDSYKELNPKWLKGKREVGVTSGASAPEHLVQNLISHLKNNFGYRLITPEDRVEEGMYFRLPKGLREVSL
tara:strand:+ start:6158 stop:7105 length:948 start_codon:yes stop_codon:yes gene_type:complete